MDLELTITDAVAKGVEDGVTRALEHIPPQPLTANIKQAARLLNLSVRTVTRLLSEGRMKNIGPDLGTSRILFDPDEIAAMVKRAGRSYAAPQRAQESAPHSRAGRRLHSFADTPPGY